jgi:formimidoylglutamate deiminase
VDLDGREGCTILDTFVFARDDRMVRDVWSAGRHMVREGRHVARDGIAAAYRAALRDLRDAL